MMFNSEGYIALASAMVSLCALGVTVWQGRQNHKHNKLSVRPFLNADLLYDVEGYTGIFTYKLMNCGIGPAIIKDFILFFDNKEIARNDNQSYRGFVNKKLENFIEVTPFFYSSGSMMQVNEIQSLITFKYDPQNQAIDVIDVSNKLRIVINYQSIYQDKIFIHDPRKKC